MSKGGRGSAGSSRPSRRIGWSAPAIAATAATRPSRSSVPNQPKSIAAAARATACIVRRVKLETATPIAAAAAGAISITKWTLATRRRGTIPRPDAIRCDGSAPAINIRPGTKAPPSLPTTISRSVNCVSARASQVPRWRSSAIDEEEPTRARRRRADNSTQQAFA